MRACGWLPPHPLRRHRCHPCPLCSGMQWCQPWPQPAPWERPPPLSVASQAGTQRAGRRQCGCATCGALVGRGGSGMDMRWVEPLAWKWLGWLAGLHAVAGFGTVHAGGPALPCRSAPCCCSSSGARQQPEAGLRAERLLGTAREPTMPSRTAPRRPRPVQRGGLLRGEEVQTLAWGWVSGPRRRQVEGRRRGGHVQL